MPVTCSPSTAGGPGCCGAASTRPYSLGIGPGGISQPHIISTHAVLACSHHPTPLTAQVDTAGLALVENQAVPIGDALHLQGAAAERGRGQAGGRSCGHSVRGLAVLAARPAFGRRCWHCWHCCVCWPHGSWCLRKAWLPGGWGRALQPGDDGPCLGCSTPCRCGCAAGQVQPALRADARASAR